LKTKLLLLIAFALLIFSAKSFAASPTELTYANFPPSSTFPCVQMEKWKEEIEKRTNGKVKVKTFPGGTLLGAKNMMEGVIDGAADIGCMVFSYHPGRFPLLEGVDLPIGFINSEVANAVLFDLFKKYYPKSLDKVKVLTLFTAPPADFISKTAINTLADLKGMEIRTTGGATKTVELLGGIPVAMPQSEVPQAMQKGIIKGSLTSIEVLKDLNFAEYCPYTTKVYLQTTSFAVIMNKDKWNALPEDVKKIIEDYSREHSIWTGRYIDNHVNEAVKWSKEKYDHKVIELSKEERKLLEKKLQPVIDTWLKDTSAKGLPANEFYKELQELKNKYERKMFN